MGLLAVLSAPVIVLSEMLGGAYGGPQRIPAALAEPLMAVLTIFFGFYLYPAWNVLAHGWQWRPFAMARTAANEG